MTAATKGKERANDLEIASFFDDLNPTITYKHVLSTTMGVHDPLRVISLADSDAFYAACEMVRLGLPSDVPLVVRQWEAVIAVNYPARKFGITRMDKAKDAVKKCSHLKVVHVPTYGPGMNEPEYSNNPQTMTHKISLDVYRRESAKIHNKFKEILPDAGIERASIDEAFFDLTKPVRTILLQRFPQLSSPPPDSPLGLDTPLPPAPQVSLDGIGNVIPVHQPRLESDSDRNSGTEAGGEEGQHDQESSPPSTSSWHDVALAIGAELMLKVREQVHDQLGYTTSAGISRNKFLAKLCASYKKPFSQSILRNSAIPGYLGPISFRKIRNLGGKLGRVLSQHYDATTVAELLPISLGEMQNSFGPEAIWIWEALRGCDWSEVKEKAAVNKSMMAAKNLPKPITRPEDGAHWISILAAELALRLKDARELHPNLWPKTLVLHARKGYEASRSKQTPFPFSRNVTAESVCSVGNKLWSELISDKKKDFRVTTISLGFAGIVANEEQGGQQSIAGFLAVPTTGNSGTAIGSASSSKRSRPVEDVDEDGQEEQKREYLGDLDGAESWPSTHDGEQKGLRGFYCSRCKKMINVPWLSEFEDPDEREEMLERERVQHADFHFAKDLSARDVTDSGGGESERKGGGSVGSGGGAGVGSNGGKERRTGSAGSRDGRTTKKRPRGIDRFFQPI